MILSAQDLRQFVVARTLVYLNDWSPAAESLLLGTAAQESGLGFCLRQGNGLGIYNISPQTHRAIWDRYLINLPDVASRTRGLAGQHSFLDNPHDELISNLRYATAIAWHIYRRALISLPDADDVEQLALTWQRHFHRKPRGCVQSFVRNYRELIQGKPRQVA